MNKVIAQQQHHSCGVIGRLMCNIAGLCLAVVIAGEAAPTNNRYASARQERLQPR